MQQKVREWVGDEDKNIFCGAVMGSSTCPCVILLSVVNKSVQNADGTNGLACRKSAGRHFRNNAVNDLIKCALASAETPAILEPASL